MKIPAYKQLLSYIYPVWIQGGRTKENPDLELLLYRGRWQLATKDAVYSDGEKYTPILNAYKVLKDKLSDVKNVLVLGSGLGSAVQIMNRRGYHPSFILVDSDELILSWAKKLLPAYRGEVSMVHADALEYLLANTVKYDLLIVDVFKGRVVPDFVTTNEFIQNCRSHINAGGSFVLNYIINEGNEWNIFKEVLQSVFPNNKIVEKGINRILVATV